LGMKRIVVASTNPVKINTTRRAFERMFPDEEFEVFGVSASSDVSDQPMGEKETLLGATNRVKNARKVEVDADYWVGIEGGLEEFDNNLLSYAWIVVESRDGVVGKGRTSSFFQPYKVAELVKQGKELGDADDIVFGLTNSKQGNGSVGILTGDVLTRTTYYEPAVILALIPFKNPELF